jgi:hypothetical protein
MSIQTCIILILCISIAAYILSAIWLSITPRLPAPDDAPTDENDEQGKTRKSTIIKKMYD